MIAELLWNQVSGHCHEAIVNSFTTTVGKITTQLQRDVDFSTRIYYVKFDCFVAGQNLQFKGENDNAQTAR